MLVQSQIVSLLNELLGQTAKLRKGGEQAVYFCPECAHYKRKLEINLTTGMWHCWTCNIKGSYLGSFLNKVKAPQTIRNKISKLTGDLRLTRKKKSATDIQDLTLPEEFHPLSKPSASIEYRNAMSYLLKQRHLLREDILRYNIGYCEAGEYAYHVICPSYDANGKLNFFIGRRYYNIEGEMPYKKPYVSMNVVGFECFINYNEPLNLCEGFFDAIAIRNNAIPLFGKFPSKLLRERMIINNVKSVNLVLDDDAYKDAINNYELFSREIPGVEIKIVNLPGKDPSKLGFEKTHKLILNTPDFGEEDLLAYKLQI